MDYIRQQIWQIMRNIRNFNKLYDKKPFICKIGIHKVRRGFGWSRNERLDVCLNCKWHKRYKDKIGYSLLMKNLESQNS